MDLGEKELVELIYNHNSDNSIPLRQGFAGSSIIQVIIFIDSRLRGNDNTIVNITEERPKVKGTIILAGGVKLLHPPRVKLASSEGV